MNTDMAHRTRGFITVLAVLSLAVLTACGAGEQDSGQDQQPDVMDDRGRLPGGSTPPPREDEDGAEMTDPADAPLNDNIEAGLQEALSTEPASDPYLFLEGVEDPAALDAVRAWNERTLTSLQSDPRYAELEAEALSIVNASDKIAYGQYRAGMVYNFWQDATHVKGLLRRTTLESYLTQAPEWETLLSIDALASDEDANWVYKGSSCLPPNYNRCLLSLSDGGKDAVTIREWDHDAKAFVEGGFVLPEAKTGTTWAAPDALLVGTDWGEGTLTESGYPYIIKRLERGQTLEEAVEVLRGAPEDVSVFTFRLEPYSEPSPPTEPLEEESPTPPPAEADGEATTPDPTEASPSDAILMGAIMHTFYERTYLWLSPDGPRALPLPRQSDIAEHFKGHLLVTLREDWTPVEGGETFPSGALVAFDFAAWRETGALPPVSVVYAPNARSSIDAVTATQSKLVLVIYENVIGAAFSYDLEAETGAWTRERLPLPDKGSLSVISAYSDSDIAFVNQESYIAPDTLWRVDTALGAAQPAQALPERFDASAIRVEQFEAESSDGERIPYFVMHPADMPLDGSNPTLLYGYGGFQVSLTPSYAAIAGKLWVENGGVYVVANLRGGGEFGPAWHQAGLKTNRQIIYDDFYAVAEDLIARGITTPDKLGVAGGSNGGLLVGVAFTQRPELFSAVVCAVPLLDMLRYHTLLAGASWMGEYGDPDIPEERAFLESISPYHNIDETADYPSILFLTSTKDDRVHPGHARKMAARLQEFGIAFDYYENMDGGHAAAANLQEAAKRTALQYTYLARELIGPAPSDPG